MIRRLNWSRHSNETSGQGSHSDNFLITGPNGTDLSRWGPMSDTISALCSIVVAFCRIAASFHYMLQQCAYLVSSYVFLNVVCIRVYQFQLLSMGVYPIQFTLHSLSDFEMSYEVNCLTEPGSNCT